ncbi:MAG: aconitate hydratase AcnA [Thermoplasmata archaeon]|nr:aconitate hydratase AcnA [Thermoplasmata archaeon]
MDENDAYGVKESLTVGDRKYSIYTPERLAGVDAARLARRPRTTRILIENLLRHGAADHVAVDLIRQLCHGDAPAGAELPFHPERILLQDFTGVPTLVDLAALRSQAEREKLDVQRINPRVPVDLVVDHSVQVDSFGTRQSLAINLQREYERNGERYTLLRWAQSAFQQVRVIPPGNGIVHQVNLEYIAPVVAVRPDRGETVAFPDTLVGTDSHTTMINGLGVLGWGVGGIEAEASMLGEPYFLSTPTVVGVRLSGRLPEGVTATDLVLTTTRRLRQHGVVDKFVEFHGPGLASLSAPDRATLSNMCPEYGATSALFPIDEATIAYLRGTGRDETQIALVEAYARRTGLWNDDRPLDFNESVTIDLAEISPTVAGPGNPEEGTRLADAPASFRRSLESYRKSHPPSRPPNGGHTYPSDDPLQAIPGPTGSSTPPAHRGGRHRVDDGAVVFAAITSCTNTSNPSVMVGAGLLAQRALARGLKPPTYVKTSLAPGSKVVTDYLGRAGLIEPLEALGFDIVGYGCTTCIGNSGPLPTAVEEAVNSDDLFVAAVLSGNRNFEARIHNLVRANYLMSPMLVVAYALAGRMDVDLTRDPLGHDASGAAVRLADLWPSAEEIRQVVERCLDASLYRKEYAAILDGGPLWNALTVPSSAVYPWDPRSTYARDPPYFDLPAPPVPVNGRLIEGARVLAWLGDRVSTDHISPAGEIPESTPAGRYLIEQGVAPHDFNTYGTRRGNHEVMIRGTFANVRLKNRLATPTEGGWTVHVPSGTSLTIFDAANRYRAEGVPTIVLAGASYGQGSSRDWAAKGPRLLGVRAVLVESFERIHRSNLVGMGVLPLEFARGENATKLGLTGRESYSLHLAPGQTWGPGTEIAVTATGEGSATTSFRVRSRIDNAAEIEYFRAGGLLPYILARMSRG